MKLLSLLRRWPSQHAHLYTRSTGHSLNLELALFVRWDVDVELFTSVGHEWFRGAHW